MTHLAEHPAVGGGYALDGVGGIVGVEADVACGVAVEVDILRGYLAVFGKLPNLLLAGKESSLARLEALAEDLRA